MPEIVTTLECRRCGDLLDPEEGNAGSERRPICWGCAQEESDEAWAEWADRVFHEARDEGKR